MFGTTPLFLATLLGTAPQAPPEDVTDAIERELLYDHVVPSGALDLTLEDGVVTLRGSVPAILAKERAVRIAETVKGVRSVVDLIEVRPPADRSDEEIRADAEQALLDDPATDSYEVEVAVDDGHLTLTGEVDSWSERQLSEKVASSVTGVTEVTNDVSVKNPGERPDEEIAQDVKRALHWNHLVDDALIDVEVEDGVVELSGTVGSAAEKRQAVWDGWTQGVRLVEATELSVARWARDEDLRKRKYVPKSEAEIRAAVNAALREDPRVSSLDVTPTVRGSHVTLHGTVDHLEAKRAASRDARHTVGVTSVENHVKVRPAGERDDAEIRKDVREAFVRDPHVERFETSISVQDGLVYLYGNVDSYFEKHRADELSSRVKGVVDVVNHLRVEDRGPYAYDPWVDSWDVYSYDWYHYVPTFTFKEDRAIERDIREELVWSPFVDADDVTISVEDGVATLTGTVDSHMERGAARDNAYEGGAVYVRNELVVRSVTSG